MLLPRQLELSGDALAALTQIIGIMSDQVMRGDETPRWDLERLMELEFRLGVTVGIDDLQPPAEGSREVTVGIDDVALLLDGMAYTEIASVDLPWFDLVRWTADFVTAELRRCWSDAEWHEWVGR